MAVINGYCTVAQVREELSDDAERLSAALLEKAVNATSRAVDDWTGRRFWQDPVPVIRKDRPDRCEHVDVGDISTTDGLIVETRGSLAGDWSPWTLDTDYELDEALGSANGGAFAWDRLVAVGARTFRPARFRTLRITARWGWSAVPIQVEEATILRAVAIFKRKETPYGIADFGEFGPVRIGRQDADVMEMLRPFQHPLAA